MEFFTIILNLVFLNFISAQIMSKCCPPNYELFMNASNLSDVKLEDVFCRRSNGTVLTALNLPTDSIGLPKCSKLSVVDVYKKDTKISCMDRITQLNDVFAIRCNDIESENVNDIVKTINIRKCCSLNRKYDWDKRYCWNRFADDSPGVAFDLIKLTRNGKNQFVNMTFGSPRCRKSDVLIDRLIHRDQVEFLDTDAISIKNSDDSFILSFDEFCMDLVDDRFEYLVVRSCQDYITTCKHGGNQVCVRKCCPVDHELSGNQCVPSMRPLSLTFRNMSDQRNVQISTTVKPAFLQGDRCTRGKYQLDDSELGKHVITTSGTVFMLATNSVVDINMYCVDNVISQNKTRTFVCIPPEKSVLNVIQELKPMLTSICAAISAFFFLLTFFLYLFLPSLRNLHGHLIMSYLIASAASYIMVVIHRTLPLRLISMNVCEAAGYVMLFTTLSSFCWLNIISYDIWSTFKVTRSTFLKRSKTCGKLLLYSLYGWGYPMVWSILAFVSQYVVKTNDSWWKSDIGHFSCWFSDSGISKIIYFIAPISIMLIFNAIIFVTIVKYCSSVRAELYNTNNCNYSLRKYKMNKNDFVINIKLFILMGLNWSLEIIALIVHPQHRVFFIVSDLLNALVGLIVFCILIMKRKVLHDLKKIFCGSGWRQQTLDRMTKSNASTSSSNLQSVTNSRKSVNRY